MTPNEYQTLAHSFAVGGGDTLAYSSLGLAEEVGEYLRKTSLNTDTQCWFEVDQLCDFALVVGHEAKRIRKNWNDLAKGYRSRLESIEAKDGAESELGDILWMVANCAHHLGVTLEQLMVRNIAKLEERKRTGTICGSGETVAERKANAESEARSECKYDPEHPCVCCEGCPSD